MTSTSDTVLQLECKYDWQLAPLRMIISIFCPFNPNAYILYRAVLMDRSYIRGVGGEVTMYSHDNEFKGALPVAVGF